ncbi:MAG TPA: TolC family protein, partial [Terriglobales bacterium]|nr:TolC family protein [Terriglobales bacterium]
QSGATPARGVALGMGLLLAVAAAAQSGGLGLGEAVASAWAHYPGMVAAEQAAARAQAEAGVAATNLWPTAGVAAQWDRGTDNASLGLAFPSPLPSISGTVPAADYSQRSAWTSAAGVYFSWEVADFGRRAANVRYYRELAARASDQSALVRLQVGAHAADAYLTAIAAEEQTQVARADLERWRQLAASVHALVDQQLRPGADASRTDAERAGARIRLSQAEGNLAAAQANLAEALGWNGALPGLSARTWLTSGAAAAGGPGGAGLHPEERAQRDAVAAARAQGAEAGRAALPRWYVLASAYGRGSGTLAPGQLAGGAVGLAPTTAGNWAVGVGADFSFTRWRAARAQQAAAAAQLRSQQARQRQVEGALEASRRRAAADLGSARAVAQESPVELAAARAGEAQARVRYQAGLAGVVDLANAEQLLAQAESDAALGQLQVWRALLESAYAAGDLGPFLAAAGGH